MDYLFFIITLIIARLVPHIPNMTPVGSMAIFLSAKYSWKKSFIVTFIGMIITDVILGFHPVIWATYGSFCIATALGRILQKRMSIRWIVGITLLSSFQFFILTNFAVWMNGILYPKTLEGLAECYIMALPFFRNTIIGDLFYVTVLFGVAALVKKVRHIQIGYIV